MIDRGQYKKSSHPCLSFDGWLRLRVTIDITYYYDFVSPGSGRYGLNSLDGYKLRDGSPCIDRAVAVEVAGEITDFYGNLVSNKPTEIGIYEVTKRN